VKIGAEILSNSTTPIIKLSEAIAISHHEKWDGTGYPKCLKGRDIPIEGRICALADVLCSKRVYKEAWPIEKVIKYLKENKARHFDPELVDIFLSCMDDVKKIQTT